MLFVISYITYSMFHYIYFNTCISFSHVSLSVQPPPSKVDLGQTLCFSTSELLSSCIMCMAIKLLLLLLLLLSLLVVNCQPCRAYILFLITDIYQQLHRSSISLRILELKPYESHIIYSTYVVDSYQLLWIY